jgi:ribosome maturation factor RimP
MEKTAIEGKIREIAARVAEESNLEFVHSDVIGSKKNFTVRIFVDKPGGVTHEDCTLVSRKIDEILDADDFIPDAYLLEVSSPGLERELYSLKDFEKFVGNQAKVKTFAPINGHRNFKGKIAAVEGDEIVFEDKATGTARFPFSAVAKANLEIDLEEELKGKR